MRPFGIGQSLPESGFATRGWTAAHYSTSPEGRPASRPPLATGCSPARADNRQRAAFDREASLLG